MEEERNKKIEAGREKLAAYKKKKRDRDKNTSESASTSHSSDNSLSFSAPFLPDNTTAAPEQELASDSSLISEHIISSNGSIENDRSLHEIEISNIINDDFSLHISQEAKPGSISVSDSVSNFEVMEKVPSPALEVTQNVQSILEEILRNEQFKSDSEPVIRRSDTSYSSNEQSLDIFGNLNLDDSSLTNYLKNQASFDENDSSVQEKNLYAGHFIDTSTVQSVPQETSRKLKDMEELLAAKDTAIAALTAELDSIRDLASNPSTLSFGTSTTEYKQYQDEYHNKIVEFQNAVAHRDNLIQQLTESLQQSLVNREELQQQSENFAKQIVDLQNQLVETTNIIKMHKCSNKTEENIENKETKRDSETVLETNCSKSEIFTNFSQLNVPDETKNLISSHLETKLSELRDSHKEEIKLLKEKLEAEKLEHELEVSKLRELLANIECDTKNFEELRKELEEKHEKEMEEVRTYFEQKCADMGKQYSEEIFSQQSRKMSDSSSCSELASDLLYSGSNPVPGGPGGDAAPVGFDLETNKRNLNSLTKTDLQNMKCDLEKMSNEFEKYDLEKISKQELYELKMELEKCNLRGLARYELSGIKSELQNKYHAELEILREDYENRIDLMNVEHEDRLQSLERKYIDKIELLKFELDETLKNNSQLSICSAVQEVGSSGEFEISEVIESYERRLQEQVALAKIDLIGALESQIQRLAANESDDEEWPSELLQLRDRFTERYEAQIGELKEQHQQEIERLKEEHHKMLSGALERARRRSLRDGEGLGDSELVKERDNLKKSTAVLRRLVGELMKYFTKCEDELNNTLIDEILKHGFDKSITQIEEHLGIDDDDIDADKKRVHFTPNFTEFLTALDTSTLESKDISLEMKNELELCLEKLKSDANAILALTVDLQQKNELNAQLEEANRYIRNLEEEREQLETQSEMLVAKQKVLEEELGKAREKISELVESGRNEIVSEGYGESQIGVQQQRLLDANKATLADLREKARTIVSESSDNREHPLVQLVEDLCREGDRLTDDAKKEHDDLVRQIEVADKKYRATCKFLEEQAAEREMERDEAQKEIEALKELLREREKDRASCERVNNEVEQLEQQMREMSKLIEANEQKQQEIELERKEAVEKIYVLRDIIRDLETQVEVKTRSEDELKTLVSELEAIVRQQTKSNAELNERLVSVGEVPDAKQVREHIAHLEEEVQRLRLSTELAGSEGALKQIRSQLFEFESTIDKRTHDLEGLHSTISNTTCSSPSEDMSIRDQIRPHTPNPVMDECDVPLQQLARLKEKLIKHARAEDAAIKRIRDLEMQMVGMKHDVEEVQNERDALQEQVTEQLVLISSLQIRLDEQRLLAEDVQKQTNTSLEVRIYDLEHEIQTLREEVHNRDKTIKQLTNTVEQTKKRLEDREQQLSKAEENEEIVDLKKQIEDLQAINGILEAKLNSNAHNAQILPSLVENIISDKNADLDRLRDKLSDTEKQLEMFLSLNLDREQLSNLSRLKSSDRALADILTLVDHAKPDPPRRDQENVESLISSPEIVYKRGANETIPLGLSRFDTTPEISSIERVNPADVHYTMQTPLGKPNSTEIHKSVERHVHFEDVEKLNAENVELKAALQEYSERLKTLDELEGNVEKMRKNLETTEEELKKATQTFEDELKEMKEVEKVLRIELAEKKVRLAEKEQQLEVYEQDSVRKDQMYINLAKEKRELEKNLKELQADNEKYKNFDHIIAEKNNEIHCLEEQLAELTEPNVRTEALEKELEEARRELDTLKQKLEALEEELNQRNCDLESCRNEIEQNRKTIAEKDDMNEKLVKEIENGNLKIQELSNKIAESEEIHEKLSKLQDLLVDRECEIEILNEDAKHYQEHIATLEEQQKSNNAVSSGELEIHRAKHRKEIAEKDLDISNLKTNIQALTTEIGHMQEVIAEKDRIINQMSEDTKSLHVNLETIQSKMQETGNIVDLAKKLREEQKINLDLQEEIHGLKATLLAQGNNRDANEMTTSIEEIAKQVGKELDLSAHLDSSILTALELGQQLNLVDEDNVEVLKDALIKERTANIELKKMEGGLRNAVQDLEQKLEIAAMKIVKLQAALEKEKWNSNEIAIEDAKLIEQMRIRLDSALDNEAEFQNMLDSEKQIRHDLESQIAALKQKLRSSSFGAKEDLTEYKTLPNPVAPETDSLKKELELIRDENSKLKLEVKALKRASKEKDSNLKYSKDMLELKNKEIKELEAKMERMGESEGKIKQALVQAKQDLERKEREMENTRQLIDEIEYDRRVAKNQLDEANVKIREYKDRESKLTEAFGGDLMNTPVPEKLLKKMKELRNLVKDNKQLTDTLAEINKERLRLQNRVSELENQQPSRLPIDDLEARANYLFANLMRAESHRKALVWQKRYLIAVLRTYQDSPYPELNLQGAAGVAHSVQTNLRQGVVDVTTTGRSRFRSVAYAIISIFRLRFITRRWHSGVRHAAAINARYVKQRQTPPPPSTATSPPPLFTIGSAFVPQPGGSSQSFPFLTGKSTTAGGRRFESRSGNEQDGNNSFRIGRPVTPTNTESLPWSGITPPSKEKGPSSNVRRNGMERENGKSFVPLKAPEMLSQYVERFNKIQNRLGMALDSGST